MTKRAPEHTDEGDSLDVHGAFTGYPQVTSYEAELIQTQNQSSAHERTHNRLALCSIVLCCFLCICILLPLIAAVIIFVVAYFTLRNA